MKIPIISNLGSMLKREPLKAIALLGVATAVTILTPIPGDEIVMVVLDILTLASAILE